MGDEPRDHQTQMKAAQSNMLTSAARLVCVLSADPACHTDHIPALELSLSVC